MGQSRKEIRARRRERARVLRNQVFDTSVPSPCVSICKLDEEEEYCLGCRRSLNEIRDWPIMTPEEKRQVLAKIAERGGQIEG